VRSVATIRSEAQQWEDQSADADTKARTDLIAQHFADFHVNMEKLDAHLSAHVQLNPGQADHSHELLAHLAAVRSAVKERQARLAELVNAPTELIEATDHLLQQMNALKRQSPRTLFRLRLVEIGVPLLLSIISIALTLHYPLTEARCREIEQALKKRRSEQSNGADNVP
jgi:hypothetical protein